MPPPSKPSPAEGSSGPGESPEPIDGKPQERLAPGGSANVPQGHAAETPAPASSRFPLHNPWPEEFIDEEPGSYLRECSVGSVLATWSAAQLVVTAVLAALGWWTPISAASEWFLLARVGWLSIPLSALLALATIVWQIANSYSRLAPRQLASAVGATLLTFAIWFTCRWQGAEHELFAP